MMLPRPYQLEEDEWRAIFNKKEVITQPKVDGIRCFWNGQDLLGKEGQIYDFKWLKALLNGAPKMDGELFDLESRTFEGTLSKFRRGGEGLTFMPFDLNCSGSQIDRLEKLKGISNRIGYKVVRGEKMIEKIIKLHLKEGWEGTILRDPLRSYSGGGFYKIKPVLDFEAKLVSFSGMSGRWEPIKNKSGQTPKGEFGCTVGLGVYSGDIRTVICNGLTLNGKPKNPRLKI